jgi:cytochrome c551/c552
MWSVEMKWTAASLVAATLLLVAAQGQAGEAKSNPYTSAKVCATCHEDIYQMWSRSLHATALTDPVFDVVYMQVSRRPMERQGACLRCHAPTSAFPGTLRHDHPRRGDLRFLPHDLCCQY